MIAKNTLHAIPSSLEKLLVALFADNNLLRQVFVVVKVLQHLLAGQPLSACTCAAAFLGPYRFHDDTILPFSSGCHEVLVQRAYGSFA